MRILHRMSDVQLTKIETLEMKTKSGATTEMLVGAYHNLPEEDNSHRNQIKSKGKLFIDSTIDNSSHLNVYTLEEEEKTQDLIK